MISYPILVTSDGAYKISKVSDPLLVNELVLPGGLVGGKIIYICLEGRCAEKAQVPAGKFV